MMPPQTEGKIQTLDDSTCGERNFLACIPCIDLAGDTGQGFNSEPQRARLEIQPQRDLHDPGVIGRCDLAERAVLDVRVRILEFSVIEHIERFQPELRI